MTSKRKLSFIFAHSDSLKFGLWDSSESCDGEGVDEVFGEAVC